jgi:shikimate kinase
MGAGKSTVGQLLASALDWDFLDVDKHIEASGGASAKELFATLGEAAFRNLESDVLVSRMARASAIIAPGGAAIDMPRNRQILGSSSDTLIVFLDAPFATLITRCLLEEQRGNATYRPLLHKTDMALERFSVRRSLYSAHAHLIVDVAERSPEETVSLISETMRGATT